MDGINDTTGKPNFIKHVFNFNDDSKSDMLNIVQYSLLSIVPVVGLNKLMQKYVPEADDTKSSLELSVEVCSQVVLMFISMFFIHRIITFVPTYSGEKYATFNVNNVVLSMLVVLLSLQTKLGEKVSILVDRMIDYWEGTSSKKQKKQQQSQQQQPMMPSSSTPIHSLPEQSQQPNYDQMYQQDSTPLMGASTPGMGMGMGMMEGMGPMPANAMGGSAFGSLF